MATMITEAKVGGSPAQIVLILDARCLVSQVKIIKFLFSDFTAGSQNFVAPHRAVVIVYHTYQNKAKIKTTPTTTLQIINKKLLLIHTFI